MGMLAVAKLSRAVLLTVPLVAPRVGEAAGPDLGEKLGEGSEVMVFGEASIMNAVLPSGLI